MRILVFVAVFWTMFGSPSFAAEGVGRIPTVLGSDTKSCEKWTAERKADGAAAWQYQQWLLGYVTAYNRWVDIGKDVSSGTDAKGLFTWIDDYCRANPLASFANAADALIDHLKPSIADELLPETVMQAFGAKGEQAFTDQRLASFNEHFDRLDGDNDGFLTMGEYVANSRHFRAHLAGARAFMRVSDNDGDGRVSRPEYVMNRIITDEAKEIYTRIDPATDWQAVSAFRWQMKRQAFVESKYFADRAMAKRMFEYMDTDNDGLLKLPEYLRAYGPWARAGLSKTVLDGNK